MPKTTSPVGLIQFCVMLALTPMMYAEEHVMTRIEGLSYLDNRPIDVTIQDGIIQKITPKARLAKTRRSPLYIAPGLIDNQVNGYASVSFGFGG
ncbi:MAG: hypothetical protein GY809_15160, partial [Planctomycetes bacterium]|nr:hypothetical protein [Planctomycetota bacterium]